MADDTPPLDDTRLAEIRRWHELAQRGTYLTGDAWIGDLLAEVDRLRAREAAAMAIVREVARQDDIRGINCTCRETMPVGHHDDCYVFHAHMLAHQLPDGSYE